MSISAHRYSRRAALSAIILLVTGVSAFGQPREIVDTAFLAKLAQAVNRRDAAAIRGITQAGVQNDFRWLTKGPSLVAPDRPWQVKPLDIPWVAEGAGNLFVNVTKYHPCESTGDHLYRVISTESGPRLGSEILETDTTGYRVRDHKLTVRFDLPNRRVHITDRIKVEQKTERLPAALLRLNSIYSVTAVTRDSAPVEYRQAGGVVAVKPSEGDQATYDLTYTAKIGTGPEDYILDDHAALTAYWYIHTGRLPATHEVAITVPRGWSAIGQGELLGKNAGATETTYSFSNKMAVSYFTVAAGKYTVTSRKIGGINVSAWLLRPDSERADDAIATAAGAIRWFSENLSPYPYTGYAVVESSVFPAALECYSFTLSGARYIPMAIVHEVAHTWWGGIVPNTYTRTLWNESFAEYSDGLYGRVNRKPGMHEFNARIMGAMIPMLGRGGSRTAPTLATANDAMNLEESAIGYGKGSIVLENLERLLGRPKMIACMQRFIKNHPQGEDADWQDFIKAVTEEAGPEWAAFFPPWLNRADLPKLRLTGVKAAREGGKYVVTGTISQSSPTFWIDTPLVLQSTAGSRTVRIPVKGPQAPFRLESANPPNAVWLDPQHESLRAVNPVTPGPDLLRFQTLEGPLLVVYATGGSAAEVSAAKSAALAVQDVNPYARIRIREDTATKPADLARSSVTLIGKPDNLRIPAGWKTRLPLAFTASTVKDNVSGLASSGTNLWGISILPHPTNSKWLLVHAASTSPQALRGFRLQDRLPPTESRIVATSTGQLVAARRAGAESGEVAYVSP